MVSSPDVLSSFSVKLGEAEHEVLFFKDFSYYGFHLVVISLTHSLFILYLFGCNLLVIIEVALLYLCFEKFLHLTYFNSSSTNSLPSKKTIRQFIQFRLQIRIKDVDLDCKYKDIGSGSYCISLSSLEIYVFALP
ncbi:hypothetical protein Hdeb2414_s0005g00174111 [Helianthus debilis subsp. tardiflorus]